MAKKTIKELDGALTTLTNEFKNIKKLYDELNEKYERLEKKSEESKSAMFVMRFFQIRSI